MTHNIIPLTKWYFSHSINRLRHTPPNEILPLLHSYMHRVIDRLNTAGPTALTPLLNQNMNRAFPARGACTIGNIKTINTGWENEIYSFKASWKASGQHQKEDFILRIYPSANSQQIAQNEYDTLKMLGRVGYPVPRVDLFVGADESPFCKPFMIMERIPGHGMCRDLYHSTP